MPVTKLFIIGSTTVPSSWLSLVIAFASTYLLIRFRYGKRISSVLADSIFYFVLVWKLSVILTDFESVIKSPLSIIYFNGGQVGLFLGLIAGMITIVIELKKKKNGMHTSDKQALLLGYVTIQSIYQVAMALMNEGSKIAELVTIFMFALIAIVIWISINKLENASIQLALLFAAAHFFISLFQPSSYIDNPFIATILVTIFVIIFLGQNKIKESGGTFMNKKMIGYLIAILVIGSMIVMTVKSNMDKNAPSDQVTSVDKSDGEKIVGLEEGNLPPDFDLTTMSGDQVNLADLKGKKVILNFWASWCGPCKAEMPHMEKYYEKNKKAANVEIIAVNMTNSERRGLKGVEEFIDEYGLTFPIPLDKDGKVERMYQIVSIPTTFMLGTNGEIVHKIIGPMDEKMMEELVNNLK